MALVERKRSTEVLRRFGVGLAVDLYATSGDPHDPRRGEPYSAPAPPWPSHAGHRPQQPLPSHSLPASAVIQSYFQGVILHSRKTRTSANRWLCSC